MGKWIRNKLDLIAVLITVITPVILFFPKAETRISVITTASESLRQQAQILHDAFPEKVCFPNCNIWSTHLLLVNSGKSDLVGENFISSNITIKVSGNFRILDVRSMGSSTNSFNPKVGCGLDKKSFWISFRKWNTGKEGQVRVLCVEEDSTEWGGGRKPVFSDAEEEGSLINGKIVFLPINGSWEINQDVLLGFSILALVFLILCVLIVVKSLKTELKKGVFSEYSFRFVIKWMVICGSIICYVVCLLYIVMQLTQSAPKSLLSLRVKDFGQLQDLV